MIEDGDDLTSKNPVTLFHAWSREINLLRPHADISQGRLDEASLNVMKAWGLACKAFDFAVAKYTAYLEDIGTGDPNP